VYNYEKLNRRAKRDRYPLPRIDDLLDVLGQPAYITLLDLRSGYWQVPLAKASQEKAAFTTVRGTFQPTVLMFGLHNSPATFQRLVNSLFLDLQQSGVIAYLDDIIIASPDFETHIKTLETVLSRLERAGLTINTEKIQICRPETKVLGHIVSASGVRPDPEKVESVRDCPRPKNVKQVRQFLVVTSWFRKFIRNYAQIAEPLNRCLDAGGPFLWTEQCQTAFDTLKQRLVSAPVMSAPNFDLPFTIHTDASAVGLGAVLLQTVNGRQQVIQYATRALSKREQKFSTVERECLAVVRAVEKFRPYVEASHFTVLADQKSL